LSDSIAAVDNPGPRNRVLVLSTVAFTAMFAVWLMLGILGSEIKKDYTLMLGYDAEKAAELKALDKQLVGEKLPYPKAARTLGNMKKKVDGGGILTPEETAIEEKISPIVDRLKPHKADIDSRFEWLLATAILAGALLRLNFGIWSDKYGGKAMMILLLVVSAIPAYLVTQATDYTQLLICAGLFGLAGNSFTVGIAWNSSWFPNQRKGFALGVFGAGNVGAAGTKLLVILSPAVLTMIPAAGYAGGLIPGGWKFIPALYSVLLLALAVAIYFIAPSPDKKPGAGRALAETLTPLKFMRVWRFSLYYVVVFGAYVALSGWLPTYYENTYAVDLRTAALVTALFIFPASLLRPFGGYLSDIYGPRVVTYAVFIAMTLALIPMAVTDLTIVPFTALLMLVGVGMGIGKASVYKYIPNYFPKDVGAVGGLVGMLGALGGFFLPKLFGYLGRETGKPETAFYVLLALTLVSLVWLHTIVLGIKASEKKTSPVAPSETPVAV